jgi:5-methylcytosine-specific restriction enzyme subunit McrC
MSVPVQQDGDLPESSLLYDKIPVRNVWLLFLYAYDLARFLGRFEADFEDSPDFKSLIARLLCHAVETRLRRNLSFGYRRRAETLKRVRGRIDILESESRGLFRRGEVACRFEELTIDTPRNRLVRAALAAVASQLPDQLLAHRARSLAGALGRAGVSSTPPTREEMASDQIARHEAGDRLMVSLARAVFDLILPMEAEGARSLLEAQREGTDFRTLFERAVANFFAAELPREEGWRVYPGKRLSWPVGAASAGIRHYLPSMITDITLENARLGRRLIIDTKFTNILVSARFGDGQRFKTSHLYQLYAYLRSQEKPDDALSLCSEGLLLYPAVGQAIDEAAEIQGHLMRFATIDLAAPTAEVVERLGALPLVSRLGLSQQSA